MIDDRALGCSVDGLPDPATGPAGRAGEAERVALRFWQQMALAAAPDGAPRPRSMAVPAELRAPLALFQASAEGAATGGHSVPSAGALYPYELRVVTGGPDGPRVFAVDVARRTCCLTHEGAGVAEALRGSGLEPPGPDAFLVLLLVRPWLSIRKYDDRGYLYAQLDTAHLGTHLLCLGTRSHRRAEWLTRAASGPLSTLLGLGDDYLFLHSVLLLDGPVEGRLPAVDAWNCSDRREVRRSPRLPDHFEGRCWQRLAAYRRERPAGSGGARRLSLLDGSGAPSSSRQPSGLTGLAGLTGRRRSAKDFGPGTLSADAVVRALAAMSAPLPTDLPSSEGFGATLVARRVDGLASGSYRVLGGGTLAAASSAVASDDDIARICMGQEHLRSAAAAVVFHARHEEIFRLGMEGVDDALLRAGTLAHLLYLGATGAGVAITTIGGFDAGRWHDLAGLPYEDEVLYIAILGVRGAAAVKADRLQPAHAHGRW